MEQEQNAPQIKPTKQKQQQNWFRKLIPKLIKLLIWALIILPINFGIAISLYHQLSDSILHIMALKIIAILLTNIIANAIIYFTITLIYEKYFKAKA